MTTAYEVALAFVGEQEVAGPDSNALILAMLKQDQTWPTGDDVPWCSAFVNFVCRVLDLPRSKSLRARSWLQVGTPIELADARPSYDVVILKRGPKPQPGPDVIDAPGHVGFFVCLLDGKVILLGGNQSDQVKISAYPVADVLGVRRIG
jgi:uncharacterized protein (TIGR02594 family)